MTNSHKKHQVSPSASVASVDLPARDKPTECDADRSQRATWGTPEWHRLHPIFGTDFSKPPHVLIGEIRNSLARVRGSLSDIGHGYTGWKEQLECAEGLLTCGISFLHDVMLDMRRVVPRVPPLHAEATPLQRDGDVRPEPLAKTASSIDGES